MLKINKQELKTIIVEELARDKRFQQLLDEGWFMDTLGTAGKEFRDWWIRKRGGGDLPGVDLPKPPPRHPDAPGPHGQHGGTGYAPEKADPAWIDPNQRRWTGEELPVSEPGPHKGFPNLPVVRKQTADDIGEKLAANETMAAAEFSDHMNNPRFMRFIKHYSTEVDDMGVEVPSELRMYVEENELAHAMREVTRIMDSAEAQRLFPEFSNLRGRPKPKLQSDVAGTAEKQVVDSTIDAARQGAVKSGESLAVQIEAGEQTIAAITKAVGDIKDPGARFSSAVKASMAAFGVGYVVFDWNSCVEYQDGPNKGKCIPNIPRGGPIRRKLLEPLALWALGIDYSSPVEALKKKGIRGNKAECDYGHGPVPCSADADPSAVISNAETVDQTADEIGARKKLKQKRSKLSPKEVLRRQQQAYSNCSSMSGLGQSKYLKKHGLKQCHELLPEQPQQESAIKDMINKILLAELDVPEVADLPRDIPEPTPPIPGLKPAEKDLGDLDDIEDFEPEPPKPPIAERIESAKSYQEQIFEEKFNKLKKAFAKQ